MAKNFMYHVPTKVYFGENQLDNLSKELKKYGTKVLLTYGGGSIKRSGLYDRVVKEIKENGLELFELSGVEPNPRIETVRKGAQICKEEGIDVLLAVGGGSTIDATKFMAAGACTETDPWDFFVKGVEVKEALPIVTILTIAATGSEMDNGGVISNMQTQQKLAASGKAMLPRVTFEDPTNTYTVSAYQTACGAADILSHIFEEYFNMNDDLYMLDCMMEGLMKTVIRYAPVAIKEPENYEARANLMWASSWALNGFINGFSSVGWSCHMMEHELSAVYDITHGLGLAILTPRWLKYCLDSSTVKKYVQFGVNVFGIYAALDEFEIANLAIEKLSEFLYETLGLKKTLTDIGIDDSQFEKMAENSCFGDKIYGFKTLEPKDVVKIYQMCQ